MEEWRLGVATKGDASQMSRHGHTVEHRGAKVLVTMKDGSQFVDVFIERAYNRRWIVLRTAGRVRMADVQNVAKCPAKVTG